MESLTKCTPKVKILIVEDEILLAEDIQMRLTKIGYEVAGLTQSVDQVLNLLNENGNIDLLIIDIKLKGEKDGIHLAEIINNQYKLPFIFLTSYSNRDLLERAKKVKPYAYMLKPFTDLEISIAIELALANFSKAAPQDMPQKNLENFSSEDNQVLKINDCLFLKKDNHFQRVLLDDITLLEADNNYTTVYTLSEKFIYSTVLRKMEEKLPGRCFLRVHRSYVVNIEAVNGFEGNTLFVGEKRIPVSKQYRDIVFNIFNTF